MKARRQVNPRVPLYVGALVLAVLMGVGIGRVIGPVSTYPGDAAQSAAPQAGGGNNNAPMVAADGHIHNMPGMSGGAGGAPAVGGLEVSAAGYTLVPARVEYAAEDGPQAISFQVVRIADGAPATRFAVVHDKPMHFFVVRRDFAEYQHVHPSMAEDGTWTVDARFAEPGPYRVYADFTAIDSAGTQTAVTLGADLTVTGDYTPEKLMEPAAESTADGITMTMAGTVTPGVASPVMFTPTRDGRPVELEPYLAAFGHLVALRSGDMGFVHVHPEPQLFDGAVKFWVSVPTPGTYRLYLDFQVGGTVHTANYVLVVA